MIPLNRIFQIWKLLTISISSLGSINLCYWFDVILVYTLDCDFDGFPICQNYYLNKLNSKTKQLMLNSCINSQLLVSQQQIRVLVQTKPRTQLTGLHMMKLSGRYTSLSTGFGIHHSAQNFHSKSSAAFRFSLALCRTSPQHK